MSSYSTSILGTYPFNRIQVSFLEVFYPAIVKIFLFYHPIKKSNEHKTSESTDCEDKVVLSSWRDQFSANLRRKRRAQFGGEDQNSPSNNACSTDIIEYFDMWFMKTFS